MGGGGRLRARRTHRQVCRVTGGARGGVRAPARMHCCYGVPLTLKHCHGRAVTATHAMGTQRVLGAALPTTTLGDMSAHWVSGWDLPYPILEGCHIVTPRLEIQVTQWSGWEAALRAPGEAWASSLTWLNMNVHCRKPLAEPVTGLIGTRGRPGPGAVLGTPHHTHMCVVHVACLAHSLAVQAPPTTDRTCSLPA